MFSKSNRVINKLTGEVTLPENFIISPATVAAQVLESFKPDELSIRDMKNGYAHYTLKNVKTKKQYFTFNLIFFNQSLKSLSFIISDKPFLESPWEDWSMEKEIEKEIYHKNWLLNQVGPESNFSWGNVSSSYDNKGGRSVIFLNYNS